MEDYEIYTLKNGIRLIHKQITTTKITHCGFILDIGSRDENEFNQGIAHFWEHMAFKGTRKRKAFHILNRLESVGGELNAYTTKEKIAFYASVLETHFEKALELLADITFDSIFPEKQIEKERNVILEEMAMYYDAPDDAIQDEFDKVVFNSHPLGMNILGTADTIRSFIREDFTNFLKANIDTENIVFASVGNLPFKKVIKLAEKYLDPIPHHRSNRIRMPFNNYVPDQASVKRQITQAHCAIGRTAYSLHDDRRLPFYMLANILGGHGMNARLNLALREKYGFVYSIDATYAPFTDTGLFGIYFGTYPSHLDRSINLVLKELKKLREVPLGTMQLHSAKVQLMGQLAMAEEHNASLMLMLGRSLLDLQKVDPLDAIYEKIEKVTAKELQELAQEMFDDKELSMLKFEPN